MFVGNLSYETVESELEVLFSEVGDVVEVFLPADRNTGRPRGFAFVEFADPDVVAQAIEKFDGHELKGRQLRINEAEARPSRPPRPSFNSGGGGGGGGGAGGYQGQKKAKPKGSRRKIRGRKRSL
ncbi:MAG: RNA-binding protein [Thermoanaerobaculia bacterium]